MLWLESTGSVETAQVSIPAASTHSTTEAVAYSVPASAKKPAFDQWRLGTGDRQSRQRLPFVGAIVLLGDALDEMFEKSTIDLEEVID